MPQIKRLTPILANQIAAGEVVERPASVVKELVENSVDAGASQIEIHIEKGGHKRIVVRDNGHGIEKDQLALALSRHATSKISTLDDLEHIASLGFRGEAMASISSVSRLTLSSNTEGQNQGWQAFAEGTQMEVKLSPAAHPIGTSVVVEDLFFNTPARRKFLKSEKTEFSHIESLITRISLANSAITFTLSHNGKRIKQFHAASTDEQQLKRVQEACGAKFVNAAHQVNSDYQNISLSGWVNLDGQPGAPVEHQYFYVNGRTVRDKLLQHALRQACTEHAPLGVALNYVLFLSLPADQVDVNVHPAKHEVRFHHARMMHDFIVNSVADLLIQVQQSENADSRSSSPATPSHDYISAPRSIETARSGQIAEPSRAPSYGPSEHGYQGHYSRPARPNQSAQQHYQQLLTPPQSSLGRPTWRWLNVNNDYWLLAFEHSHWLVKVNRLVSPYLKQTFTQGATAQPLLLPIALVIDDTHSISPECMDRFKPLGFELSLGKGKLIIKAVPAGMRDFDWATLWQTMLNDKKLSDENNELDTLLHSIETSDVAFSPTLLQSSFEWLTQLEVETAFSLLETQATSINLPNILDPYIE